MWSASSAGGRVRRRLIGGGVHTLKRIRAEFDQRAQSLPMHDEVEGTVRYPTADDVRLFMALHGDRQRTPLADDHIRVHEQACPSIRRPPSLWFRHGTYGSCVRAWRLMTRGIRAVNGAGQGI